MRIMIFGRPGSGKSTCASALSQKLELPLHHLDKHFFVAHWVARDYEAFLDIQYNIVAQKEWIIDGNSLQSLHIRYSEADVCIYFNYPRWRCLLRLIKRMFMKNPAIEDRAPGCRERISWHLIKYMWTFEYRLNNRLALQLCMLAEMYPKVQFYTVRNDQELKEVMSRL